MNAEFLLPSFPATLALKQTAQQAALTAFQHHKHKCLVMGATGAVGRFLVGHLLSLGAFERVTLLTRRPIEYKGPHADRLHVVQIKDFHHPENQADAFQGYSHFFCTHGTTRAQAGSAAAFRQIDRDFVLQFARVFRDQNPNTPLHMLIVTATNSTPHSLFLYPKTKGEIERALTEMGFHHLSIFRPGFLKQRPKGRWVEEVAGWMLPVAEWLAPRKLAVECEYVARAMQAVAVGLSHPESAHIFKREPLTALWGIQNQLGKIDVFDNEDCVHLGAPLE